ncbi:MAG: IS4/Tn5 family transposase DNA-binding protein, partial [Burkholderiales bacterium]
MNRAAEIAAVEGSLKDLGPVEIVAVTGKSRRQSATWTGMMEECHYLGACTLRGAQMRYLIRSPKHGLLGAASFSAATRRLACREEWIGWSETALRANLQQVVSNSRFLIAPSVNVPHLASHALGQMLRRISDDWQQQYGYELMLAETFVDPEKFEGICYRAANWERIGATAGREEGFANKKVSSGKKDVYVYALREDARQRLCREPDDPLRLRSKPIGNVDWVEQELATARVFDSRLRKRMLQVTRAFAEQAQALVPQTSNGSAAEAKATYRFFKNPRVSMKALLKGHSEATLARAQEHAVVLSVQDTTYLNYTAHSPEGAGPIGQREDVGLILHATVAFTLTGTPLGVMDAQCWARNPDEKGKRHKRDQLPIEQKETVVWLR